VRSTKARRSWSSVVRVVASSKRGGDRSAGGIVSWPRLVLRLPEEATPIVEFLFVRERVGEGEEEVDEGKNPALPSPSRSASMRLRTSSWRIPLRCNGVPDVSRVIKTAY
jgi:hypothetical protein